MIYEGTAILKLIDHMIDTDTAHPTSRRFAGRGYEDYYLMGKVVLIYNIIDLNPFKSDAEYR